MALAHRASAEYSTGALAREERGGTYDFKSSCSSRTSFNPMQLDDVCKYLDASKAMTVDPIARHQEDAPFSDVTLFMIFERDSSPFDECAHFTRNLGARLNAVSCDLPIDSSHFFLHTDLIVIR